MGDERAGPAETASHRGSIAYLCLQSRREGHAAFTHVGEIIRGLERRGWRVDLFEVSYAPNREPGPATRLAEFLRVQWRLMRYKGQVDALYVRSHFAALPASLWARFRGVPTIREVNGTYEDLFISWPWTRFAAPLLRWVMRLQHRWADVLIAMTPMMGQWLREECGHTRVFVIPNGADTGHFRPDARTTRNLPENYVLFFGALSAWQGVDTMLEAVVHPAWPRDVKLVIAGEGTERPKVEAAAARGEVVYLGVVPYQELPGVVAGSIAGLSPQVNLRGRSDTGLFPLKLFETLACGVPVIVSDFPGMADLVRGVACGIVIPLGDPEALSSAVRYLYQHPGQRREQGCRGQEAVVADHSWDSRAAQTHELLLGILRQPFGSSLRER